MNNKVLYLKINLVGIDENLTQDEIMDRLDIGFCGDYKYIEYEDVEEE